MKTIKFLPVVALAILGVSCQNGGGNGLSSDSTKADSLMYYLGQMRAVDYDREAKRDTTLDSPEAKRAFLQGFQAGMSGMRADDEAYNRGFMQGMQMAVNMKEFTENYDVQLNGQVFMNSLKSGLSADSLPDSRELQKDFRNVMNAITTEKENKDKEAARLTLNEEAAKLDLPKINDDLYGKVTETTDGEQLKMDDDVTMEVKVAKIDGSSFNSSLPSKGKIGARNFPNPLTDALVSLKNGETGKFATTAMALYGSRCKQLGLEPTDFLTFTLKADLVKEEPKDKK